MSKYTNIIYILMGNIGSGKSTYAKNWATNKKDKNVMKWVINQDLLGSRENCLKFAKNYLEDQNFNNSIMIDRTNISKKQRSYWISLAKKYNAECHLIEFQCTPEKCIERVIKRKDHPTIKNMSKEKIESIVNKFKGEYETPTSDEGFDSFIIIDTSAL